MPTPQKNVSTNSFTQGQYAAVDIDKSFRGKLKNLEGQQFEELTVLSRFGSTPTNKATWLCKCSCGKSCIAVGSYMADGRKVSCGCLGRAQNSLKHTKHGQATARATSRVYHTWVGMVHRCTNSKSTVWKNYGGRGIKVCSAWLRFENFYADMGDRPEGLSLDRTDVNGNYEPGNCRWADKWTQARNKRVRKGVGRRGTGIDTVHGSHYRVRITIKGSLKHLGCFPLTPEGLERAKAVRELAEFLYWGEPK